jgi:pyruvate dehydrogenase E2 component (dihydrolipoamide acetyltransferase)
MAEFRMPSLGADMEVGTIVEWRVRPGDTVHRGDIIAVVDTEKSTIDVEVFDEGTVEELLVEQGEEVPVGTPLARIGSVEQPAAGAPQTPSATPPRTFSPLVRHLAEHEHVDLATIPGSGPGGTVTRTDVEATVEKRGRRVTEPSGHTERVVASPLARRRAAELGIDLQSVPGEGPDGAVVAADVARAVTTPSPAVASDSGGDSKASLRASVAALMARSKREIPHYYLSTTIDLGPAVQWLAETNENRPVSERMLPAALLLRATTLACQDNQVVNGHWRDGAFAPSAGVHIGVAVSLRGGGLVAPALRDAQDLTLDALMARLRDLVNRARAGRLRSSEMTDPSVTVTNLGDRGVEAVFGVIYPPQVALVGFGKIVERPWAEQGMLTVRPVVTATLAADHRVSDGHDGARFLAAIDRYLQHPESL